MASLTIKRGDDESYQLTFVPASGDVQSLDGCTVWFTVKPDYPNLPDADLDDGTANIKYYWQHDGSTVTASAGLALPAGSTVDDGLLIISFPDTMTTTFEVGNKPWKYDIQIKFADGTIKTWDEGQITVAKDLTRRQTVP